MIREIDKMLLIRSNVSDAGKKEIDGAIEVIKDAFTQVIDSSKEYILDGEKKNLETERIIEALAVMRKYALEANVAEIPEIKNSREALIYVLKFGSELIK